MNKKIVRISLALLFVSLLITAPRAQQTATQSKEDRVALYQALLDLTAADQQHLQAAPHQLTPFTRIDGCNELFGRF